MQDTPYRPVQQEGKNDGKNYNIDQVRAGRDDGDHINPEQAVCRKAGK